MKTSAWVPPLAPLIAMVGEQDSPDAVLNDFMAVGFNFDLPPELDNRFGPRKRAYMKEVQDWVKELDVKGQWDLSRALARQMSKKHGPYVVDEILEGVGWKFEDSQFIPLEIGITNDHAFFPAGATHGAYVHIRTLFKGAEKEVFIVDGYVDTSLFDFLLSTNGPKVCRIMTLARSIPHDFVRESTLFSKQHGFQISIRTANDYHDRQINLDGSKVFVLGASIKDAGKKAFNITPIENPALKAEMIRYSEEVWSKAAIVL